MIGQSTNDAHCDTSLAAQCGSCYHHPGLVRGALIVSRTSHGLGRSLDHRNRSTRSKGTPLMRIHAYALALAITGLGQASISWAQAPMTLSSATPALTLQLDGDDQTAELQSGDLLDAGDGSASAPSPFDIFEERVSGAKEPALPVRASQEDQSPALSSVLENAGLGASASQSQSGQSLGSQPGLPVSKAQEFSPADRILAGAHAVNQQHYHPPINWNAQHQHAPNHTANYMMNQWCADGLWDNYAAERARACVKQQQRIYGRPQHCPTCPQPACTSCRGGWYHAAPHAQQHLSPSACDSARNGSPTFPMPQQLGPSQPGQSYSPTLGLVQFGLIQSVPANMQPANTQPTPAPQTQAEQQFPSLDGSALPYSIPGSPLPAPGGRVANQQFNQLNR